jgi:probable addiction module antidote protein
MPRTAKKYEEELFERLRDREYAVEYLNGVLEDDGADQQERFLLALRDVAKAYGIANLAADTELAREALYRTLSKDGNPRLTTLLSLLDALELKLSVTTNKAS